VLLRVVDYAPPDQKRDKLKTPEGVYGVHMAPQEVVDSGDQGLQVALNSSPSIAACMVARGKTTATSAEVDLEVDPAGHVVHATAKASEPALGACLTKALPTLALSCSADGQPHATHAVLALSTFGPLGPTKKKH
jgi:hypothetical protein